MVGRLWIDLLTQAVFREGVAAWNKCRLRPTTRRWLAKESQREALAGYLFILPTFLGYTIFVIGPILGGDLDQSDQL